MAPMRWCAAVHSAWIVYMLPPSPVNPTTVRSGWASFTPIAPGMPDAERAAAGLEELAGPARRQVPGDLGREGQRLVEDDRVVGQPGRQRLHELRRVERDRAARLEVGVAHRGRGLLALRPATVDPPAGGLAGGRRQPLAEGLGERRQGQLRVG